MSTNSRIGYQRKDGTIRSVYVHQDGYPTGVGATLIANHDSAREALRLLSIGDISALAGTNGKLAGKGSSEVSQDDSTGIVTYNRWRNAGTARYGDVTRGELQYNSRGQATGAEYLYLFRPGYGWFVAQCINYGEPVFVPLAGLLLDEEKAAAF